MPRIAQLILALLIGLALLTWAASGVVETTVREWFERDVSSRGRVVLISAEQSLAQAWSSPNDLNSRLLAIARDERIMAVTACDADFKTRSATPAFPPEFNCLEVGTRVRNRDAAPGNSEPQFHEWSTVATLPTGQVQVSAMPILGQGQDLGFAVLVQDLTYIDKRENRARTFLIVIFGILAVAAFGVPLLAVKRARSDWSIEVRKLLRGGGKQSREFQPILSDMRELLGRMSNEQEDAPGSGLRQG